MRHFILILTIAISILSCDQTNNKEKEHLLKEKELQVKVDSLNPTKVKLNSPQKKETEINTHISSKFNMQAEILNKWLWETIGCDFPLDSNTLKRANFNTMKYYETKATKSFIEKLLFKVNGVKPEITISSQCIALHFATEDDGYETFHLLETKVVYSRQLSAGPNGMSYIYNLSTHKEKEFPFVFITIKNNIAEVGTSGYYDGGGRYWVRGKFNLVTGKTIWGPKE